MQPTLDRVPAPLNLRSVLNMLSLQAPVPEQCDGRERKQANLSVPVRCEGQIITANDLHFIIAVDSGDGGTKRRKAGNVFYSMLFLRNILVNLIRKAYKIWFMYKYKVKMDLQLHEHNGKWLSNCG